LEGDFDPHQFSAVLVKELDKLNEARENYELTNVEDATSSPWLRVEPYTKRKGGLGGGEGQNPLLWLVPPK